jgi:chemotaxis protein methyltransferase CheR
MDSADFDFLSDFVKRRSGLALTQGQTSFIRGKLAPVARRFGFRKVDALLAELRHEPEELSRAVAEAMTTNESSFFRDRALFDHFRGAILPALMKARANSRRLRIWCAAASMGQEPYSLAMILDEAKLDGWRVDLIATDLNSEAIARAKDGLYSEYEVARGLSVPLLLRYFTQENGQWRIAEKLRRMVSFRAFNLLDSFGWLGQIDVIYCRNVLIYFDHQDKFETLERLSRTLAPDGFLVLGTTETTSGISDAFVPSGRVRGMFEKSRHARQTRLAG